MKELSKNLKLTVAERGGDVWLAVFGGCCRARRSIDRGASGASAPASHGVSRFGLSTAAITLASTLSLPACGVAEPVSESIAVNGEAIAGDILEDDTWGAPSFGNCSMVQLSDYWVLTALHCNPSRYRQEYSVYFWGRGQVTGSVPVAHTYFHPWNDVALVRLSTHRKPSGTLRNWNQMYRGASEDLVGRDVTCLGYRSCPGTRDQCPQALRQGYPARVAYVLDEFYDGHAVKYIHVDRIDGNPIFSDGGDSGGPCFVLEEGAWQLIGVLGGGNSWVSVEHFRDWAYKTMSGELAPTEAQFYGDRYARGAMAVHDVVKDSVWYGATLLPDNSISSLRTGSMATAQLYYDANFAGTSSSYGASQWLSNIGTAGDQTSSIRVRARSSCPDPGTEQVTVWADANFTGACDVLDSISFERVDPLNARASISSVKVGAAVRLTLYESEVFGGASRVVTGNVANLANVGWDNRARSLRINGSACAAPSATEVVVWEHENFTGACRVLGPGAYPNASAMNFANDTISSAQVGVDVRFQMYEDEDFFGAPYNLRWDHAQFRGLGDGAGLPVSGWQDRVSSARVRNTRNCGSPGPREMVLWEHANFTGRCNRLELGQYLHTGEYLNTFDYGFDLEEAVSSIQIGANTMVNLYGGWYRTQEQITFHSLSRRDVPDLSVYIRDPNAQPVPATWDNSVGSLVMHPY